MSRKKSIGVASILNSPFPDHKIKFWKVSHNTVISMILDSVQIIGSLIHHRVKMPQASSDIEIHESSVGSKKKTSFLNFVWPRIEKILLSDVSVDEIFFHSDVLTEKL